MDVNFKTLEWDSQFFNVKVAQLNDNVLSEANAAQCLVNLNKEEVDLVYYNSKVQLEEMPNDLYKKVLVIRRVPIVKQLTGNAKIHPNISFYDQAEANEELTQLAHRAGKFSKFSFDPNIPTSKVIELYELWLKNSVEKTMASDILVYKEDNEIKGFVTIQSNPPEGKAPLFAVSKDAEGKGVSFALMQATDAVLFNKGCSYYSSATQASNKTAVTVFKRHGFEIFPEEYVYHLWRNH